jgi:serine phosphatase RsbU (regulator of sigma subunit)
MADGASALRAAGKVCAELLSRSHLLPPGDVAEALVAAGRPLGIEGACVYLADLEQRQLRPLPGWVGDCAQTQAIDSTLAGRVYQTVKIHHIPADAGRDGHRVLVPLVDGTERLGVLELSVREAGEVMLEQYRVLASLTSLMIVSKASYSDTYAQTQRSREMTIQAELVWAFLAPRTFATDRFLITATLEPAYEIGGDAFDYSLIGDRLHVSIFDAAGHDLAAGLLASVGMASCRSTRRAGGTLLEIAGRADHAIARQFGHDRFVTALLCDLDLATGQFCWLPCGHPPPLLIRGNKVVKELLRRPRLPLGLSGLDGPADAQKYGVASGEAFEPTETERLEPGDRVLLYTDGVTEGRAADGTPFGTERLSDFVIRHSNAETPAPETLRRLNRAITDYQHGRLTDDATIVLLEWMPDRPDRNLLP